jgi:16S rRNA (guanine966-N2)-methyltransferase
VRVVAGTARGRRLAAPPGRDVRPTTDRVREAVFNALNSLDAVAGATALDLFAGTGALGIEALSRGARRCTFVERDRAARTVVAQNLAATGLAGAAVVVGEAAERFVARSAADGNPFDLALLDPPYAYTGWDELLAALPAGLAVIESDRDLVLPDRWEVVRRKWYGTTLVAIARAQAPPAAWPGRGEQAPFRSSAGPAHGTGPV